MTAPAIQTMIDGFIAGGAFPTNIVSLLETAFNSLDLGLNVVMRQPSTDDPNYTVGIVAVQKTPMTDTIEIHGPAKFAGATFSEYLICVYAFVKDANRERGEAGHAVMSEVVEHTLVDDPAVRAALGSLQATVLGTKKAMGRHYIRQTRFLSNELNGDHLYMSSTEVVFEVQKS